MENKIEYKGYTARYYITDISVSIFKDGVKVGETTDVNDFNWQEKAREYIDINL